MPYYERELGLFRQYTREFAHRYPKVAGRLHIAGETCEDPHVERLIQSFALLTARVAKRLDDDYPQLTESLLETLYPHFLRPFPCCAIVRIGQDDAPADDQVRTIARGTVLRSPPVQGVACKFTSTHDVTLAPLAITQLRLGATADAPPALPLPPDASAVLSISFAASSAHADLSQLALQRLRLFVDGEPSLRAVLFDALVLHASGAYIATEPGAPWQALDGAVLAPAGYDESDALLPFCARSHPALRLLSEYFAFPDKFYFIDLLWPQIAARLPLQCRRFTLHLLLRGVRSDSHAARLLAMASPGNLLQGCTPVINLFHKTGVPIRYTDTEADHALIADASHAPAYEIHSIESVSVLHRDAQGERLSTFLPLYSALHGARHEQGGQQSGNYWLARRDQQVAAVSPGHETRLCLIDPPWRQRLDQRAADDGAVTIATQLLCSNRDLPTQLPYGQPQGDLQAEDVPDGLPIRFLRKPTPSYRQQAGKHAHWRLISHLSLNYSGLTQAELGEFQKMLSLYDLPCSATTQRLIEGITGLAHGSTRDWMAGAPFPTLMPGIAIRMTLDEQAFAGSSLAVFAQVFQRYFAMNNQLNCFSRLTLVSQRSGEELVQCPARYASTA
ncbi:type VI secretion system baseplate subunit TssF [Janthinobacterium aquaticum]|nr:type VI secretion system baseplate subunit TssF [Janthinobacterium sp. FT58W]